MAKVHALLLAGLLVFPALAQGQSVIGTVIDDETGASIAGARIEVVGSPQGREVRTDSTGAFLIHPRVAGFVLRITHPAYADVETESLTVGPDEALQIEVRMGRQVVPLEPLVVKARRSGRLAGYYQRLDRPGFARFVTREQIARRRGAATTDLLRDVPGVHIRRYRTITGTGDNLVTMRGGQCIPAIYIDGIQVGQSLGGGLDGLLRPETIEGVEVYTGSAGLPPMFVPDGCGVVAFWTRTGDEEGLEAFGWRRILFGAAVLTLLGSLIVATR